MLPFPRIEGSYAEYAVVPTLSLARKPASLSHVEAAGVPLAALTAWGLVVETAHAHEGQRILIHAGSGGVGHFAVQLAAYFGAHVTATGSTRNASWLRELGASTVIDHSSTRFEDVVSEVDVVIDLVGNAQDDTGTRSLTVIRPGGLYVLVPTGSFPGFVEAAGAAGVRATSYKVIPDGTALATVAGCSSRERSRSTSTGSSTWPTPRLRTKSSRRATRAERSSCGSATTDGTAAPESCGGEHPPPLGHDLVGDRVEQRRIAGSIAASTEARRRALHRAARAARHSARRRTGSPAASPSRGRA